MKLSLFRKREDFPVLVGEAVQVRDIHLPLLEGARHYLDPTLQQDQWIVLAAEAVGTIDDILAVHREDPWSFPDDVARAFSKAMRDFVTLNAALRHHFMGMVHRELPVYLFHFTIKYHYMEHLADRAQFENPRMSWCYAGEAFMMQIRRLVASSSLGPPASAVGAKVVLKYATAISRELAREARR